MFGRKPTYQNYPHLDEKKLREVHIVGESHYQENLAKAAKHLKSYDDGLWVALVAEPANPHDRNAVRVDWVSPANTGPLTVGYIPGAETAMWHPIVGSAPKGIVWCWPAELMGGTPGKSYGLYFMAEFG
jgi:hypothetical protein